MAGLGLFLKISKEFNVFNNNVFSVGLLSVTHCFAVSACADTILSNCRGSNVYESIQCIEKDNKKLIIKLDNEKIEKKWL